MAVAMSEGASYGPVELKPGRLYATKGGGLALICLVQNGGRFMAGWWYRKSDKPIARKFFPDGRCIEGISDSVDIVREANAEERADFEAGIGCSCELA